MTLSNITYIHGTDVNSQVKFLLKSIKEHLPAARLMVMGRQSNSLNDFGNEILKRDVNTILSAELFAGFEDFINVKVMSPLEIFETCKTKKLKFIKVNYKGKGCWG